MWHISRVPRCRWVNESSFWIILVKFGFGIPGARAFLRLDVQFGAFLAVILGLFIPVVFLVTLFIQSDAQGTATSFRQPDSIGGTRFEDE